MSGEWLSSWLPGWVIDTLLPKQKIASYKAEVESRLGRHPGNIRFSLPGFGRRYFLTIVGGEERRSPARGAHEKHRYPLHSAANKFFSRGIAAILFLIGTVAVAIQTSLFAF